MIPPKNMKAIAASLLIASACGTALGAKLVDVRTVDERHVMIQWLDGEIDYRDDGTGKRAFMGHESGEGDRVIRYEPELDTTKATEPAGYAITSEDDADFAEPVRPANVYRKSKVNGTNRKWPEADYTVEHTVFLELPKKLRDGAAYTLSIAPETNTNVQAVAFTFDTARGVSEAIHVNIIGYNPDHTTMKSADLYMWMGDGGARDYSDCVGRKIMLINADSGETHDVGKVALWKKQAKESHDRDVTQSDVWNCDFSAFTGTGRFRLAVEGVGCSPDFEIRRDIYFEPYKTSVRGFFYMRIGMDKNFDPPPRQPRFIPDVDPPGFKVYRTTFGPAHPDWRKLRGDVWDRKDEWVQYREPGEPTNPNAWGGHSDALDWDRHSHHVSIIWDMLLPYFLSNGKLDEDDLGIAESGNGIPDIIDEALYEIDFWLRLRDGEGGYSFGINNPSKDYSHMHQAAARPYMAWMNAASCAMVADCFRIAGRPELVEKYKAEALEAWESANDEDLDFLSGIGNGQMRGRDLKMMAAAHLYNITGDTKYEEIVATESVVDGPTAELDHAKSHCQLWGTAAYLMCAKMGLQPIHHPELAENMKASMAHEAMRKNVEPSRKRVARRSTDDAYSWFQGVVMVHPAVIAHAVLDDGPERETMLKAMLLEADYAQGRNPMNMVHMTGLGSRCAEDIYTSGRDDGVPGVHPGHTPYMGTGAWGKGYGADPMWYARKGYPEWDRWPHAEGLWRVRYCYANNEFTPQQTMRGKMLLLGYLYSLGEPHAGR